MNVPGDDEDDHGEVFLDEDDIVHDITVDDEDLPDADDEAGSDSEDTEEPDDSMHLFTGHTSKVSTLFSFRMLVEIICCSMDFIVCYKDLVSTLAFSTDGQLLASGNFDGLIQAWDVPSGSLKCTLEGPGGGIEWVRWHPGGHLVLAGSEDATVWMWNADKSTYLNMFSGHGNSVTCGDFTPDGKTICTGSDDVSLRIWNPRSGENIHVVRELPMLLIFFPHVGHPYHTEGLTCLTISSDSTLCITGLKDSSVHIVNIATGKV
ncbi:hypothetical protein HHK36_004093 [Tetracentron sinense]|uniref:Angio-associated migratory cell protein n=1 Tax=Tetracentron sinense TaxID=13715 RepID=A0A834ZPF9_TETSI|nr:hypothetical protein HHK36_004093 [Tetracentron sinense]